MVIMKSPGSHMFLFLWIQMYWDLVSSLDSVIKCFASSLVPWEMGLVVLRVLRVYVFCV